MVDLVPPEQQLGFSSPALGPWFDSAAVRLIAPKPNLSVALTGSFDWLPPTSGIFSLFVNDADKPTAFAGLRQADSSPAFTAGSLVAVFRLLPEVEERLDELMSDFATSADGQLAGNGVQRRARIRYLALELTGGAEGIDPNAWDVDPPAAAHSADLSEQAAHLGLKLTAGGLKNTDRYMRDMKRPGRFTIGGSTDTQVMLRVRNVTGDVFLWAFDDKCLAVDPGAVAAWWLDLAQDQFEDQFLWAPGLDPDPPNNDFRTATTDPSRLVHLVNPHEGPTTELLGEVNATNLQGAGNLRRQDPATAEAQLTLQDAQNGNRRRLALLPNGEFSNTVSLWAPGNGSPTRDFVRVALVDLDRHLVGPPPEANDPAVLAGVRPQVRASNGNVFEADIDAAAQQLVSALDGNGERHLVAPTLDRDWGAFPVANAPDIADFPNSLQDPEVTPLIGGGEADGDTIKSQRILVALTVAPEFAGAWLRVWPHGFDHDKARHIRLNGGAAPVDVNGVATTVITLPGGSMSSRAPMGMDVLLTTAAGSRFYGDLRFERPAPVGGTAEAITAASGPFLVCEAGVEVAAEADLANPGRVPPGATVVSRGASPSLVDPDSLEERHLTDEVILSRLSQGVSVALTVPAFRREARGSSVAALSAGGATVDEAPRNGTDAVAEPGAAFPGQFRLDVAAGRVDGQDAVAAIASAPALSRYHEQLPHQSGHPGVPASDELHGTGAVLRGPAALPAIEYLRDRTARATLPDLFNAARNVLPNIADPAGPVKWTALLRTVSPGVEGEPGLGVAAQLSLFPFGQTLEDIIDFLRSFPGGIPAGINSLIPEAESVARALDRRIFAAANGFADALVSINNALGRAEHFVYIETPAADILEIGDGGNAVWSTLLTRMQDRPGLRVLVCHPVRLLPGLALRLEQVRNSLLTELPTAEGRIELFSANTGPDRSLRLASTTVIVDDAYAMSGTSHLWRRGMTFDSSVSVAAFDEQLDRGRPAEIRVLRRNLIAGRLGILASQLPEDPSELLLAIRQLRKRGGGHRLATELKEKPELEPSADDKSVWNRDGLAPENLQTWINDFFTLAQSGALQDFLGDEVST
jgi:hypothetical protein